MWRLPRDFGFCVAVAFTSVVACGQHNPNPRVSNCGSVSYLADAATSSTAFQLSLDLSHLTIAIITQRQFSLNIRISYYFLLRRPIFQLHTIQTEKN